MDAQEKILFTLRKVNLVRARFSRISQAVIENRQPYFDEHRKPPEELSPLMAQTQESLATLMQTGRSLQKALDSIQQNVSKGESLRIQNESLTNAHEILQSLIPFLKSLPDTHIPGFILDPDLYKESLEIIDEVLNPG